MIVWHLLRCSDFVNSPLLISLTLDTHHSICIEIWSSASRALANLRVDAASHAAGAAPLRSVDMHRCRLTVVHTRHYEAYASRLELHPALPRNDFAPVHSCAWEKEGTVQIAVLVILLLECKKAYVRFPRTYSATWPKESNTNLSPLNTACRVRRWRRTRRRGLLVLAEGRSRVRKHLKPTKLGATQYTHHRGAACQWYRWRIWGAWPALWRAAPFDRKLRERCLLKVEYTSNSHWL